MTDVDKLTADIASRLVAALILNGEPISAADLGAAMDAAESIVELAHRRGQARRAAQVPPKVPPPTRNPDPH